MSFARRMRKKAIGVRPVVEIGALKTRMHVGTHESGDHFTLSVEDATLTLGYRNVEVLTRDVIERVRPKSRLTLEHFEEALRLDGAYSHDSDSVLFVGDEKWTRS